MTNAHEHVVDSSILLRQRLQAAVERLDRALPRQGPIRDFVSQNKLQGFQHLPFEEALATAEKLTGIHGYPTEQEFRGFYANGRINDADLAFAFASGTEAEPAGAVFNCGERCVSRSDIYRIALLHGVDIPTSGQFNWNVQELNVLRQFQQDVPAAVRGALLDSARLAGSDEEMALQELWDACVETFELGGFALHPEELVDLSKAQAESILAEFNIAFKDSCPVNPGVHRQMRVEARAELARMLDDVGGGASLCGVLRALTGMNLLDEVRPILIRFCAWHLDEGLAAWRSPHRPRGLYAAWRACAGGDFSLALADLPEWRAAVNAFPEHAVDAVIAGLRRLDIPEPRWEGYLERLALELPGWSGIVNWRQKNPDYAANHDAPVSLMDYLAIRLFLDTLWMERICRKTWGIRGCFGDIENYFKHNLSEFMSRQALFEGILPEYLADNVQQLIGLAWTERGHHEHWRTLADMIWTWRHTPFAEKNAGHTVFGSAWRLFRLSQHLGMAGPDIRALPRDACELALEVLDELTPCKKGYLWLLAFEHNYRENLFNALVQNHGRGRWRKRGSRPQAQLVFCMDDREEGIRRHLEELNPALETLGAAGFFGVAMYWRGLDDAGLTPLCPLVVKPAHEVREEPQPGCGAAFERHRRRRRLSAFLGCLFNQEIRRNLLSSFLLIDTFAPWVLGLLAGKIFFPRRQAELGRTVAAAFVPAVPTRLALSAAASSAAATAASPRLGFTDAEQADRVAGLLRTIGLTSGFAPLVVLSGHGSLSQNNPHLAAYDCGACSGRRGGSNARAFAAMANRPEIRALLAERGIAIPEDTRFIGSEHNTCNEEILWFDSEDIPPPLLPAFERLKDDLSRAAMFSAHERCRRFASAPLRLSPQHALRHVIERAADFSQARPELGHTNNAAALIGRRSATQGVFFDRRLFLISYDPSEDPGGNILENILMAAGPVSAGINLEYFFSRVNNENYGCSSKVPHNVTGLFGVMEGANGDLRTGFPRQMIELHEPMRLQMVVETTAEVMQGIYDRQPLLQELFGNRWVLLSIIHPETGVISCFDREHGFTPWSATGAALPRVKCSTDWYAGFSDPRPAALVEQPEFSVEARDAD